MSGSLDGIRVIDFGQYIAGPLTAMMFADQGADVVRVDPPGGPRWQNHANAVFQRGKRSIVLDLKDDADAATARRLVESADVVIEGFRPGVMQRLGLGADEMMAANPRLIYCSIPGFAADDARAGVAAYEGVVEAAAGIYPPSTWDPDPANGAPLYNALPLSSTFSALRAGQSIVAALIVRQRDGRGQRIEVPLFDATFEMTGPRGVRLPGQQSRIRARSVHDFILDAQFECKDGRWVNLSWLERRQLPRFAARFGSPDWEKDGLLNEDEYRQHDTPESEELKRRLIPIFKSRTAAEWGQVANPDSDLAECLLTSDWLHTEEHARTTGAVISLRDDELGETMQLGYPFTMSKTPSQASPRHALDADKAAVLAELDASNPAAPAAAPPPEKLSRALEGIRVLDLAQVLAGPTCGRLLAEFGADVIKVNNPKARDVAYHQYVNSGKRTMLLDLKSPEGKDILWRLLEQADVLSLNFSPPACERLELTEADVRRHKADIVYSSISAFGWNGPRGNHRGHEQLGQAVSGVETRWGQGFREPVMQSFPICDMGTGNLAAFAIMLALFHRLRTGEGQFVGTSLAQTGTYHQAPFMLDYAGRVWDETGGQEARGSGPLNRLYKGSDRWFFLAALGADGRRCLATVEGLKGIEAISDAGLGDALSERFAAQPSATWVQRLTGAGIGAHAVRTVEENMEDDSVKARGLSVEREFPTIGLVRTAGPSGRLSRTPARLNFPSQPPGTNNREILEELGMAASHDELLEKGVIAVGVGGR